MAWRVTDVIVDVARWKDAGLEDAVVVSMINHQQTSWTDQRPEVTHRPSLLRQSALEVGQCGQRVAKAEHGVKERVRFHVFHMSNVVLERQPVRFLDN